MTLSDYQAVPQIDDADDESLAGLLRAFERHIKMTTEDCIPATVIEYDDGSNTASIQPQLSMVTSDGTLVKRTAIASAPVMQIGGGGFLLRVPVKGGSRGWLKATDRDMSLYLQSMNASYPATQRMHSFSDGFFIPDAVAGFTVNGEDNNNLVLQNTAGTIRIALWADRVKITTPGQTFEVRSDRILATTPLFQVAAAAIQFTSTPVIGALSPAP